MFSRTAYLVLHLILIGAMAAVFFVAVEKRIFTSPTAAIIVLALAFGAAVAYGLRRTRFVPSLLDVLAVAPVVFLVIFFFFSDTSKLILPQSNASALGIRVPSKTPVVEVIFDEFPTATLLDGRGRIDAKRFPHFAALARQTTWYPNNTTVADFTGRAVPAILTGNNPSGSTLPIASDQPNSIFSLLGGAYRLHVKEVVTQVCPSSLCGEVQRPRQLSRLKSLVDDLKYVEGRIILPPSLANELPNVSTTFGNFGNNGGGAGDKGAGRFAQDLFTPPSPGEFEHFLDRIPGGDRTLSLIHMELPHEPWRYLPSGQNYLDTSVTDLATPSAARWAVGTAGIASAEARHYLQTGYADRLVGLMMARLKKLGIWKKAMVIVTADHGISFQGKSVYRRIAQPENLGGVANPPLFIKYPGQTKGKTSPIHTETIDIVPTIAQQLGIAEPLQDGGRADQRGGQPGRGRRHQRPGRCDQDAALADAAPAQRGGQAGLLPARQRRPLPPRAGSRADRHLGPADLDRDPARHLGHGRERRRARGRRPPGAGGPGVHRRRAGGGEAGAVIAVAVNGTVEATGRAFLKEGELKYGVVVPPGSFIQPGETRSASTRSAPATA